MNKLKIRIFIDKYAAQSYIRPWFGSLNKLKMYVSNGVEKTIKL